MKKLKLWESIRVWRAVVRLRSMRILREDH